MSKKIYLIDGNSFIYRMFFAIPEFTTSSGKPVNATFGMAKFFVGQLVKEKPDYVVFIKDAKGTNFRHDLYEEYKATRERMPDNLRSQISDIEAMIGKMNIDIIEIPGYEADDVIWTLAIELWKKSDNEIYILSGDKDLYALVTEQVKIYDTQRKKISWPDETFEKFGVPASCVRDYLAICGDSSDNIPGIAGIWPKKATVLLNEFWSLEKIYEIIGHVVLFPPLGENWMRAALEEKEIVISPESQKILKGKTLEKFVDGKENAFLSQKLATLACDVNLENFALEDYSFDGISFLTPQLEDFFTELEFFSLVKQKEEEKQKWKDTGKKVQIIWDSQGLEELSQKIEKSKKIVLDTETSSLNPREAELIWVSLLLSEDEIFYINHLHSWPQITSEELQSFLKTILKSDILIIGHNIKYDLQVIESFLSSPIKQKNTQSSPESHWQTSLEI